MTEISGRRGVLTVGRYSLRWILYFARRFFFFYKFSLNIYLCSKYSWNISSETSLLCHSESQQNCPENEKRENTNNSHAQSIQSHQKRTKKLVDVPSYSQRWRHPFALSHPHQHSTHSTQLTAHWHLSNTRMLLSAYEMSKSTRKKKHWLPLSSVYDTTREQ